MKQPEQYPNLPPLKTEQEAGQNPFPQQLQAENAQLRERIAELEAALASAESQQDKGQEQNLRTAKATETRQSKAVDAWKGYLQTAVRLAVLCMENKEQAPFTRDWLAGAIDAEKLGALTEEACQLFRSAMPGDLMKGPGAPSK